MNNKGFTLVELLAIVVIISIIATVAVPNITNEINSSDKHTQNVVDESIENASKLYVAKYYAKQFINGKQIKFTLTDLENDGLLNLKSGVCDGFKNKDIVVNNHVYDYKELTTSCYSKAASDGTTLAPTTSPTPTTDPSEPEINSLSMTKITEDNYVNNNKELFIRAFNYMINVKKVSNGNFSFAGDAVMAPIDGKLRVNAVELMKYYNSVYNDYDFISKAEKSKNLIKDASGDRTFTISYSYSSGTYSTGLCNLPGENYDGYIYKATYKESSKEFNFNNSKIWTTSNICPNGDNINGERRYIKSKKIMRVNPYNHVVEEDKFTDYSKIRTLIMHFRFEEVGYSIINIYLINESGNKSKIYENQLSKYKGDNIRINVSQYNEKYKIYIINNSRQGAIFDFSYEMLTN